MSLRGRIPTLQGETEFGCQADIEFRHVDDAISGRADAGIQVRRRDAGDLRVVIGAAEARREVLVEAGIALELDAARARPAQIAGIDTAGAVDGSLEVTPVLDEGRRIHRCAAIEKVGLGADLIVPHRVRILERTVGRGEGAHLAAAYSGIRSTRAETLGRRRVDVRVLGEFPRAGELGVHSAGGRGAVRCIRAGQDAALVDLLEGLEPVAAQACRERERLDGRIGDFAEDGILFVMHIGMVVVHILRRGVELATELKQHLFDTFYHAVAHETPDTILITADELYLRPARAKGRIMDLMDWEY
jgi:hypothetical protein